MDRTTQMANELEKMIERGEIAPDVTDEVTEIVQGLKKGKQTIEEFYGASTPQKLLSILDVVNERVKRY
ncbi:hypothetical protein WQ54_20695 [Bacillus sp. SA1-12]|uniref:hypothetical protein n=1 Tax=Bacillus sp. SA1-12 TaxID=1455638 RepID=UPI00062727FA|nr:hypothetical protein [Bacillus sp. SA1-12]KKI90383.1 hypothetical protein WQ54_20695 [Bacillus sp. SA1-12]